MTLKEIRFYRTKYREHLRATHCPEISDRLARDAVNALRQASRPWSAWS